MSFFSNGNALPIFQIGTTVLSSRLALHDILFVPHVRKKLLSMSKLTNEFSIDFLFSCGYFAIWEGATKGILAKGKYRYGLYILSSRHQSLFTSFDSSFKAYFETCHKRWGHVSLNVVYNLNSNIV